VIPEVRISARLLWRVEERYPADRTADGRASRMDFIGGPLAAALLAFREFGDLPGSVHPDIRSYTVVDPAFGPVVFVGVRFADGTVELADFEDDPEFWM
jgi:hypothetical protein